MSAPSTSQPCRCEGRGGPALCGRSRLGFGSYAPGLRIGPECLAFWDPTACGVQVSLGGLEVESVETDAGVDCRLRKRFRIRSRHDSRSSFVSPGVHQPSTRSGSPHGVRSQAGLRRASQPMAGADGGLSDAPPFARTKGCVEFRAIDRELFHAFTSQWICAGSESAVAPGVPGVEGTRTE